MNLNVDQNVIYKSKKPGTIKRLFGNISLRENADTSVANSSDEAAELLDSIKRARNEWINANTNFDYVEDQEMIDYYAYKIKACEVSYQYYLKKAKEMGIKVDLPIMDDHIG